MSQPALGVPELLVILLVVLLLFRPKKMFRGGPRPPHPIPADDTALLTRKRANKRPA